MLCDLDEPLPDPRQDRGGRTDSGQEPISDSGSDGLTRHLVVKVSLTTILAAVGVTGTYGLFTQDWSLLTKVWLIGAAPFGVIFSKYVGDLNGSKAAPG